MNYRFPLFGIVAIFCLTTMLLARSSTAAEIDFIPGITLNTEYDDNIDFDRNSDEAIDDFAGNVIPEARLEYHTERLHLTGDAKVDVKKYLNETDFDRTNQFYEIGTEYQTNARWNLSGNYNFRRDETTDSQFEETGRVFERKRAQRHNAKGGARFALTELTNIGSFLSYEKADFSGTDSDDYDLYTIEIPFTKIFQNQLDTITLTPAYSYYNSDGNEEANDYRLTFDWKHLISETLTFEMGAGPRYTTIKDTDGKENSNFGGVGKIALIKSGETFKGSIRYSHGLRPTTEGQIINVDRLWVFLDKRMTERLGIRFAGQAWYSNRENNDEPNDKVFSFDLNPAVYYMLTENHLVELAYDYRNQREFDEPGNPVTQRNQVWVGLQLRFPKKWF